MASSNRADRFDHLYKALRKHYKSIVDANDRRVLDYLLYACCLEDSSYEAADEAFAKLQQTYFDANEIRVTTVSELSESLTSLPKAASAAGRLKKSLQSLFEARYSFDIDDLKKANLGKAIEEVSAWEGTSKFVMAYVTQHAFGGHSIPVDNQILSVCMALDLLTIPEASKGLLPGIERAIPKNKGLEFASLLHQFAVEYATDFHHPIVNAVFKEMGVLNKQRVSFVAPIPVKDLKNAPLAGTAQHLEATNAKAKADKLAAVADAGGPKAGAKTAAKPVAPSSASAKPVKMASAIPAPALSPSKESKSKTKPVADKALKTDSKPFVKVQTKSVEVEKAIAKPKASTAKSDTSKKSTSAKVPPEKATPAKPSVNKASLAKAETQKPVPKDAKSKSAAKPTKTSSAKSSISTSNPKKTTPPAKPATPPSKKGTTAKQLPVKAVTKKSTKPR